MTRDPRRCFLHEDEQVHVYALVRLGESFLYADVLAARTPDVATAERLQQALVQSSLTVR